MQSEKNIHATVSEQLKKNFAKSRWKVKTPRGTTHFTVSSLLKFDSFIDIFISIHIVLLFLNLILLTFLNLHSIAALSRLCLKLLKKLPLMIKNPSQCAALIPLQLPIIPDGFPINSINHFKSLKPQQFIKGSVLNLKETFILC